MKKASLYLMALLYIAAGINHFASTKVYMEIMPAYIPWHLFMVYLSGVCEVAFGVLLLPAATRKVAAWLIIVLLMAVFPANVQMMLNDLHHHSSNLWLTIVRLPLQLLLIWWAYTFTKPVSSR